jgi:hypothetical protein
MVSPVTFHRRQVETAVPLCMHSWSRNGILLWLSLAMCLTTASCSTEGTSARGCYEGYPEPSQSHEAMAMDKLTAAAETYVEPWRADHPEVGVVDLDVETGTIVLSFSGVAHSQAAEACSELLESSDLGKVRLAYESCGPDCHFGLQ